MERQYQNISIRPAAVADAEQLCRWWNDGAVMAHAGFPKGLGTTVEKVAAQIESETEQTTRRHMVLSGGAAIGELCYRDLGDRTCDIGINICDAGCQNKGLGKIILSLLIDGLFASGYEKIVLDTNLQNTRAQHVYEQLGFRRVNTNVDSWKDQLGKLQSSIDYELTKENFISYLE